MHVKKDEKEGENADAGSFRQKLFSEMQKWP